VTKGVQCEETVMKEFKSHVIQKHGEGQARETIKQIADLVSASKQSQPSKPKIKTHGIKTLDEFILMAKNMNEEPQLIQNLLPNQPSNYGVIAGRTRGIHSDLCG